MAWWPSRCSAQSATRHWRHGRRRARGRVRSSAAFAPCRPPPTPTPIVVLYAVSALLGGIVYLYFRIDIRPDLERAGEWPALGLFDIKEHFVSIGLALLPAYWVCWRRPRAGEPARHARRADLDTRRHRLVGLSDRSRPEQHQGLRRMTSSRFRRFAFAYGTAFAVLYVVALKLDLALFTVYPSLGVVLLGTHHSRDIDRSLDGVPGSRDVLVRLDRHGRARSARVRARCRALARAMDAARLVGLAVGGSRARDDRVRLPHIAMVSTLATGRVRSLTGADRPSVGVVRR